MEEQTKKLGRPPKEINTDEQKATDESKEKVVISKEEFNKMQKDIDLLKKVASRYKIEEQEALERKGEARQRRGFLKRLEGKLIVKWLGLNEEGSKAEQKILYQGTTPVGEVMIGHYKTIDNEDVVTDAVRFYRSTDLEHFTITGQEGSLLTLRFDNPNLPQEYKLDLKFVNP